MGITTTFRAEGASFLTLVSPPGWYWYGLEPPVFQGSLCWALATVRSEEVLVGEVSRALVVEARTENPSLLNRRDEVRLPVGPARTRE